jgi:hypothetical protein
MRGMLPGPWGTEAPPPSRAQGVRSQVPAHQLREVIVATVRMRCVNEGCTAEFPVERLEAHLKEDCAHRRYVRMRGPYVWQTHSSTARTWMRALSLPVRVHGDYRGHVYQCCEPAQLEGLCLLPPFRLAGAGLLAWPTTVRARAAVPW